MYNTNSYNLFNLSWIKMSIFEASGAFKVLAYSL